MNILRYLTFEVNRTCNLRKEHVWCPIGHPERYKFGQNTVSLTDDVILEFYKWCKFSHGFRGIVLWHMYSEPTLALDRIYTLMEEMKKIDKHQPFQLTTNLSRDIPGFDIVHFTDYGDHPKHDDRILTREGEGLPYDKVRREGICDRGLSWEIPIDNYGNWCLCCGDWRCEESVGNIFKDGWDDLYLKFKTKSKAIRWKDETSYGKLPRLCRACLEHTPNLCRTGSAFDRD